MTEQRELGLWKVENLMEIKLSIISHPPVQVSEFSHDITRLPPKQSPQEFTSNQGRQEPFLSSNTSFLQLISKHRDGRICLV